MITKDDRTPDQKKTHRRAVVARDSFLSNSAFTGGNSRVAWACSSDTEALSFYNHIKNNRQAMKYVSIVNLDTYRPPRGTSHFHIYVVEPGDPGTS